MSHRISRILTHLTPSTHSSPTNQLQPTTCSSKSQPRVALVFGAGDGLGSAICRIFAKNGLIVVGCRRKRDKLIPLIQEIQAAGGTIHGMACDARKEEEVSSLVDKIEKEIGPIHVAVYNIGANVRFDLTSTTTRVYRKVWEMANLGGFLVGREVARVMKPRGEGTIIFSGATASVRASAGYSAFSSAKFGLRSLAQSCARELGPLGIHVSHVVIDGAIDMPWIRENFVKKGFLTEDQLMNTDDIAQSYWFLYTQPKSAWTFEMDLRPFNERWTW